MTPNHSDLAPNRLATLSRRLGGAAVIVVMGLAMFGPAVEAQLPELPPLTLAPTDPATTTSTLLPPLEAEKLLPAPESTTPPPSLLPPLPTTDPPRRTTTYKPPAVPPSTPVLAARAAPTPKSVSASKATPPDQVEGAEVGEADTGFGSELPFADQGGGASLSASDTVELGAESSARQQVGSIASVAAGLLAFVLLGVALWLRSEIRRPAALPPW